jgi:iron complex transport system permease protein
LAFHPTRNRSVTHSQQHRQARRYRWLFPAALVAAALALLPALAFGSEWLGLGEVARVVSQRLGIGASADPVAERIVWQLRAPRALLALLVGGGLAITGVAMQALVRNPLAEPYILGVSSGAAAGLALFYLGFLPTFLARSLTLPLAAFAGGLLTITVVFVVARTRGTLSVARLLLAGVALSALMGAVSSFVTFASPDAQKLQTVLFLLMGSLHGARWSALLLPAVVVLGSMALLLAASRWLDALLLGEDAALALGVPVEPLKRALIGGTALITGVLVAQVGAIGFVGLIVPHAVRLVVGVPHRRVLPLSFVVGGLFLLVADLLARSALETQVPVGVVTALCGVPFFLMLLRRGEYHFG